MLSLICVLYTSCSVANNLRRAVVFLSLKHGRSPPISRLVVFVALKYGRPHLLPGNFFLRSLFSPLVKEKVNLVFPGP